MSDSSLKQQLKVITIPVFIEIALVMLLGAVDTVMLSRYSDNSVAAVGLDNQLMSLVFLVYQFFSMGAGHRRYCLSLRRGRHLPMEHCRRPELRHRHPTRFWPCRHVDRLCARREYPRRHPSPSLALRQVAQQGICQLGFICQLSAF